MIKKEHSWDRNKASTHILPKACGDIYLFSQSGGRILHTNQLFNPPSPPRGPKHTTKNLQTK